MDTGFGIRVLKGGQPVPYNEYAGRGAEGRAQTAHEVAWSAVKKKYRKDVKSGKWELAD